MRETSNQRVCTGCDYMVGPSLICTKCGKVLPVFGQPLQIVVGENGPMTLHRGQIAFALVMQKHVGAAWMQTVRDLISVGF